ncbi:bacterial Ig-like domain-containing protein [Levilactobacillus cerevisiae]|uniref:bacterial Ig-like domain-containing protein n=1 Tax=Levilactobacillus cerevisiae TaxID=1704076 RepID=UPI00345E805E
MDEGKRESIMMAKKNWQRVGAQTEKRHYKLYKAGKLWLTSGMTALTLLGGLWLTSVNGQADTGHSDESVSGVTAGATSSAVMATLKPVAASATASSAASSASSSDAGTPASVASSSASQASSVANPVVSSAASSTANVASSGANSDSSAASSVATNADCVAAPAPSSAKRDAGNGGALLANYENGSATGSLMMRMSSNFARSGRMAAPAAAVLPTEAVNDAVVASDTLDTSAETMAANGDVITDGSTITPPETEQSSLGEYTYSNFYVQTSSKYVLYNAVANVTVYPYNTKTLGSRLGGQLWGFYLILPKSITSSLANAQESASNFLKTVSGEGAFSEYFSNFTGLEAYRLNNTTDGRQVYYFRPNDGATSAKANAASTATWPAFKMLIYTGDEGEDGTTAPIDINAVTYAELSTAGVLFAGVGDLVNSKTTATGYPTITTASLGINAPDSNIAGLIMPAYQSSRGVGSALPQLSYMDVLVNDTYNVVDGTTGETLGTQTVQGLSTETYQRENVLSLESIATQLGLDASKYSDDLAYSVGTATDTMGWHPNIADLTAAALATATTKGVTGTTYTVYLNEKSQDSQADLDVTNKTIPIGSTWTKLTNLVSATDADGTAVDPNKISVAITNLDDGSTPTAIDTTQAGNYALVYTFTDQDGTDHQATTTLFVSESPITVKVKNADPIYAGSNGWTPADNFVSGTDASGQPLTVEQLTESFAKVNDDGTTTAVTRADLATAGTFQVTYTYTEGSVRASAVATVTVLPNQSAITFPGTTTAITVGDDWTPTPVTATDVDGTTVPATATITNAQGTPVTADDMTRTPGTYTVTYSFVDQQDVTHTAVGKTTVTVTAKTETGGTTTPTDTDNGHAGTSTPGDTGEVIPTTEPQEPDLPGTTQPVSHVPGGQLNITVVAKHAVNAQGTKSAALSLSNGGGAGTITASQRRQRIQPLTTDAGFAATVNRTASAASLSKTATSPTTLPQTSEDNSAWLTAVGALSFTLLGLTAGLERKHFEK